MFARLVQATVEYQVAITNLAMENLALTDQLAIYSNHLFTKEADNEALQKVARNLQG